MTSTQSHTKTFLLFGRTEYAQPLQYVRTISTSGDGPDLEQLRQQEQKTPWIELVLIPEEAIVTVIPEGQSS